MELPSQAIGIHDFREILQHGFVHTIFNGLKIGDLFEYTSEIDNRVLVMRVADITYYADGRPCLTISRLNKMYV